MDLDSEGGDVEQDVFVRLHAREGEEGGVEEALREVAGPSREEDECLSFQMFRSVRDRPLRSLLDNGYGLYA